MDIEELRKKVYERLGLEFGSLPSESGNDWQRAKEEILQEEKQREFETLKKIGSTDYISISKESEEFKTALNSFFLESYNLKISISQRTDLINEEINKLLSFKDKDILINLSKYQKLSVDQIDTIIPMSVYLVKRNLIEYQELTNDQKSKLTVLMNTSSLDYKDLIDKINT